MPAKTPRPIGRTDIDLPGIEAPPAAAMEAGRLELRGVGSIVGLVDPVGSIGSVASVGSIGMGVDVVIEVEDETGELVLRATGNVSVFVVGLTSEVVLVAVVTELDAEDRLPFISRVHVLTSCTTSFPSASFTGVRTMTQVSITVPIGEFAVLIEVTV